MSGEYKELRDFERGRSLSQSGRQSKWQRRPSPNRHKIGNLHSARGFCTHCNSTLANRIERNYDATKTAKDFMKEYKLEGEHQ